MHKQFLLVKIIMICLFSFTIVNTGFAQILSYTTATDGSLNSVATHATGTALIRVNGAASPGSPCSTGFSSTSFPSTTTYATTLQAIEVTVTAASGYQLSVTGFSVDMRRSASGPASVRYAYSTNGGTTWTDQGSNQSPNNAACGTTTTGTWTTSFNVSSSNTLKFRVYGFNASSTAGTFQMLNLTINGTVTATCIAPTLSTSVTNVSCNGGHNGAVSLTLTGGSAPFTYSWSNSATTQNISGLTAANYAVTVTATGGCTAATNATVTQPSAPVSASVASQTNVVCGGTNGQATASGSGGTTPYSYSWNTTPVQTTATATGLSIGSYTVAVIDAHGCSDTDVAVISILSPGGLNATSITSSSATLGWNAVSSATSYNIQYRQTGTSTWTSTSSSTTSKAISGLSAGTSYEFLVQTVCSGGSSSYSSAYTFTTTGGSSGPILSYTTATDGSLNSVAANATGTALAMVNGANAAGSPCSTGLTTKNFSSTTTYSSSLAAIEVTVTPSSGYTLNITGFSADLRRSATGPASVRFAYSTDGGSTWINQGSDQSPNNASCGTTTTGTWTTSFNTTGTLKFRLYGYNASSTVGVFQILNLNINGSVSGSGGGGGGGGGSCNQTIWNHVYNSYRLIVIDSCTSFTGIVANKINEADGDVHIRVTPDAAYTWMINSYNTSGQHGDMVVEPVCAVTVTQSDAVAACTGFSNSVYIPNIGEHVTVTGDYITDNNHGWNEIHPVTSITIIAGKGANTSSASGVMLNEDLVKVYPNPVASMLYFTLEEQPSSVIYISIVDAIGRLAGQYQMLETKELKINTIYLPSGKYYYSIVQNSKLIKGGSVIINH